MDSDRTVAPDQPSPEALPLMEAEEPIPVPETLLEYPPGVERPCCAAPGPRPAKATAAAPVKKRKKKKELTADWHAKRRMIFLCLLLLIANLAVGTYLFLTWGRRAKRQPEPVPVQPTEKPLRGVTPSPDKVGRVRQVRPVRTG